MMRGTRRSVLAILTLAAIVMSGIVVTSSGAATIVGEFELDGNLVDSSPPDAPYDWDTLPRVVFFPDPDAPELSGCPAGEDDSFGGSSTEEEPGGWEFVCQSVPSKDDFLEAGIGTRKIGTSDWLYLYFIRAADNGSAALNYEFNRSSETFDNDGDASTPEVPVRTVGDILINLEVANGGADTTIQVFSWTGDREIGNWVIIASSPVRGVDWDVATNAGANGRFDFAELALRLQAFGVTPTCPGLGKAWIKSNSTFDFENGVLKDHSVRKDVPLSSCAIKHWEFTLSPVGIAGAQVFAVYTVADGTTRTLELFDPGRDGTYEAEDAQVPPGTVSFHFEVRIGGALVWQSPEDTETLATSERKTNEGELTYQIVLTPEQAENFVGEDHVFTATVTDAATGDPLPNVPVNFALRNGSPPGCGSLAPASGITNAAGQVSTTVSSATPCTTEVVAWINGTQQPATAGLDAGEANDVSTKVFVDYAVTVTPAEAENEINDDHVFTVLLTRNDDGTPTPVVGATLALEILPASGDAHFTEINGQPASGTTGSCVTRPDDPATAVDEAGTCSVTIVSPTPGDFTLHATFQATSGSGSTRTFEGSGDKHFLNLDLDVTPDTATNDAGSDLTHVFTVTLRRDDGTGLAPYAGRTVSLALNPGTTGATITAIPGGTIGDPPVTGACTTDVNGQCTVTITATGPGTATLTASYQETLSGGSVIVRNDTATKVFADFNIDVTPDSAENDVDTDLTHVFTVTLTRNTGSGPQPYAGRTVSLALNPGTTGATITAIPGGTIGDPPVTGTCTTDVNGQCTVTITATGPGTATLTATYQETLDGGAVVVRSDTATKVFTDFNIDVTPDTATNDVDSDLTHVFTVTLTRAVDDTGFHPYPGRTVSLSLAPGTSGATITAISNGTIGDPPVTGTCTTDANGQCTVTITATGPGTATLTATYQETLTGGSVAIRNDTGTKVFSDFELTITPPTDTNQINDPHTFTVRLTRNDGDGPIGFGGQTITVALNPGSTDAHFTEINGQPASGTSGSCVTTNDVAGTAEDEGGFCFVTIVASTTGTVTLTANWSGTFDGQTFTRTAQATKVYFDVTLTKNACPADTSPRGGVVDYSLAFSVTGTTFNHATLVDTLPAQVTFVGASPIAGATPTTSAGTVSWSWDALAPGSYTGSIRVLIKDDVALGTAVTNSIALDSDEMAPKTATHTLTVDEEGRSASGRAFGLNAFLLGSELIAPTPDSDETNPGEVLSIPDPFGSDTPLVRVLSASESDDSTALQAAYSATASAADVDLNIPGVLHLQASTVVAKTSSQASASGAGSSRGGSLIQNLVINDHPYGVVSEPVNILVRDPLSGDVLAEVHLLETIRTGAANGEAQPNGNNDFASGITVNGIHVKVHLLDLADIIVSHSETQATFPSGLPCGDQMPAVSGSAYALNVDLKPDSDDGIDLGSVRVAEVKLPITGGHDQATLAHIHVPDIVQADAVGAETEGEITDGDDEDTVPIEATSEGHVAGINLLDGAISATAVKAISHSEANATPEGRSIIAHLEIGGTDVCASLGLSSICEPEPNTELLIPGGPILVVLNEQIPEPGGLTVNAVHIWVLGKDNPFGLPVGAQIIIANAHSDAHPAGPIVVEGAPAKMNVRGLSSPSAAKLRRLEPSRSYRAPIAVPVAPVEVPEVSVPDIVRDPAAVLDDLAGLELPDAVLDDAQQLVETLTDPAALLEALADPATLFEGLEDPAAALDALAEAVGVAEEAGAEENATPLTPEEELAARLRRLVGL